jgi:hypothetical protein
MNDEILEENYAYFGAPLSTETFKEWFANTEQRQVEIETLLERLGGLVVKKMLSGSY